MSLNYSLCRFWKWALRAFLCLRTRRLCKCDAITKTNNKERNQTVISETRPNKFAQRKNCDAADDSSTNGGPCRI